MIDFAGINKIFSNKNDKIVLGPILYKKERKYSFKKILKKQKIKFLFRSRVSNMWAARYVWPAT